MTPADTLRRMIAEADALRADLKRKGPKFGIEACAAAIRGSALRDALNVLTTSYAASATDEHYDSLVLSLCEALLENGGGSTPALALPGEFDNVLEIARHRVAEREAIKEVEKEDG